ncbi:MAG TPA: hypothetical protein PLN21_11955 [Gemmatales bacterium]|nr:hypothetical protein [Gemmatales bacterium]
MDYPVLCEGPRCKQLAVYKIAARWSDGQTSELKTYGLACDQCLPAAYQASIKRQLTARTLPGEVGEHPGIYRLHGGDRDRDLVRMNDLELRLKGA